MDFTNDQKKAIETRDKNLLVSASAGTGKTTVMIERIVELIKQKKAAVDEIVVVTFTIAAAAQMKEKLRSRLTALATEPYIYEQLEKLDLCNISTLHSFCSDFLRTYFYIADVDPSYSILEPLIVSGVKQRVLDDVFAEYYKTDDEAFNKLNQIFHNKRTDETLKKVVIDLYEFSCCQENFEQWYAEKSKNYDTFGKNNDFERALNAEIVARLCAYSDYFDEKSVWAKNLKADEFSKYIGEFSSEFRLSEQNSLKSNFEVLQNITIPAVGKKMKEAPKGVNEEEFTAEYDKILKVRDDAKKAAKGYAAMTEDGYDKAVELSKATKPLLDKLVELTLKFRERFSAEKKEKSALDFSDLEHLALTVLNNKAVADEIRQKYKFIFVDEYQDINSVQEAIIQKLGGEKNLFMVGDVKQSIYGFRQTNPDIFVEKIGDYSKNEACEVINLNDNFRSDKRILEYVNQVFTSVMTDEFGKVNYGKNAKLCGKGETECALPPVSVIKVDTEESPEAVTDYYDLSNAPCDDEKKYYAAAEAIAEKIKSLIGTPLTIDKKTRPLDYGDVAVLMRDMKEASKAIYNKLKSSDIPVAAEFDDDLQTKECSDVINFLRAVDNQLNDVYVCGAAMSFFGGMTENELAAIKVFSQETAFIDNLKKYVAKNRDGLANKAASFIERLNKYRHLSYSLTVEELMQRLVTDEIDGKTYLLCVKGMTNGQLRYEKLTDMLSAVKDKQYGASIDKYLEYIDSGEKFSSSSPSGVSAVTLTTIHKSKGLEYPIVITSNVERAFYHKPTEVFTDKNLGIAMRYYDFDEKTKVKTLAYQAMEAARNRKENEEEMRLLYVLLTRAKAALVLVTGKDTVAPISPRFAKTYGEWLAYAAAQESVSNAPKEASAKSLKIKQINDEKFVEKSFSYKYDQIDVPLKISASLIRYSEETTAADEPPQRSINLALDGTETANAALLGTAYHRVYENATAGMSETELSIVLAKLVARGEVTKSIADAVDIKKIENGLSNAELAALMQGEIYREIPFMLKFPYNQIFVSSDITEPTVLQGTMDMLIVRKEGATVIDFKYTSHPEYIKKNYTPQLTAYKIAAEKILGLPTDAYVLSIKDNKLIKII